MNPMSPEDLLGPLNDVEQKFAPARLYVAGNVRLIDRPRVSLIGSRAATDVGRANAATIAAVLVRDGVVVVSGLAEGIDTVAHETAIQHGGRTIAVLGTPLDVSYPVRNRPLQERIMREHLAITQFAPGIPSRRGNFPMRNRTMALVSHATVIVEAGASSGTLHQGWEALRLGRPLFILDGVAGRPDLEWPRQMINYGAVVIAPSQAKWILNEIPLPELSLNLDPAV